MFCKIYSNQLDLFECMKTFDLIYFIKLFYFYINSSVPNSLKKNKHLVLQNCKYCKSIKTIIQIKPKLI